jgi:hypothetical protein
MFNIYRKWAIGQRFRNQIKAIQYYLFDVVITCTFHTRPPRATLSGQMGGRTFSFFFPDKENFPVNE